MLEDLGRDRIGLLNVMAGLRENEGVSILYITHDLSTAYHIADELIVMLDGEIVERGDSRAVIDAPTHPYTRLLIDSVPVPDPDVRWQSGPAEAARDVEPAERKSGHGTKHEGLEREGVGVGTDIMEAGKHQCAAEHGKDSGRHGAPSHESSAGDHQAAYDQHPEEEFLIEPGPK